jgi:hypothetical protein
MDTNIEILYRGEVVVQNALKTAEHRTMPKNLKMSFSSRFLSSFEHKQYE